MYVFIFGSSESLLLRKLSSSCGEWVLLSGGGVQASLCSGFSCCGAGL